MQSETTSTNNNNNVINLFTGQSIVEPTQSSIIQICPENSGIKMLYANHNKPERLISVPVLCWGIRNDGETVGIVPWIGEIRDCTRIEETHDISWEGYYLESTGTIFSAPPEPMVAQLATAMRFIPDNKKGEPKNPLPNNPLPNKGSDDEKNVAQEIPDLIGTHALIINADAQSLLLTPVVSWALDEVGEIHGMLVNEDTVEKTPVIPGDDCLYSAASNPKFCCYFQREIAEQIRLGHPETIEAIEKLLNQR